MSATRTIVRLGARERQLDSSQSRSEPTYTQSARMERELVSVEDEEVGRCRVDGGEALREGGLAMHESLYPRRGRPARLHTFCCETLPARDRQDEGERRTNLVRTRRRAANGESCPCCRACCRAVP